eukprot:TRINITY_DN4316_c0_g1_i1.p1 TRINITY_DN4316_c0_g1~~TRINITY_DN4316_c0_g1_i1.p1  ORF type:complete len:499 (-),score=81.33 TRINITY_DN4316_c0_g1_i1:9-1505(-)
MRIASKKVQSSFLKFPKRYMGAMELFSRLTTFIQHETTEWRAPVYDPTLPLEGHQPLRIQEADREYNITKLENGFTVLTESPSFPSNICMGILMDVGARDESPENSGACQALKNIYLKTLKHTNETINYGMVQMSGGDFSMEYDQEKTMFRANCLEHDVIDMFQMMVDCAMEPRSLIASNIARVKNHKIQNLNKYMKQEDPFSNTVSQDILTTGFGYSTLGMPLSGMESNVENINYKTLSDFMLEKFTPNKCVITASGVKNHKEFVDLVKEKFYDFLPQPSHLNVREKAKYIGGEARENLETPMTQIALGFETVPWTDENMAAFNVMNTIIGSATPFSQGGPGKGMHCRAISNVFHKYGIVQEFSCFNNHFSDSGMFGINIVGSSSYNEMLLDIVLRELNGLREPIPVEELNRSKNLLKINVLLAMERQIDRLEEVAKNYQTFGELTFHKYCELIDKVTSQQINQLAEEMLKGRPSMVVKGMNQSQLPGVDQISSILN